MEILFNEAFLYPQLSEAVKYAPLVLVPSHNSYFDFLLTSLICFAKDLPLPAIASGQGTSYLFVSQNKTSTRQACIMFKPACWD